MRLNRDDQRKAPRQASRVPVRHSSRTSELPTMAPSFRLKHYWNKVLDWLYPGSASVCVLCNRAIPAISEQQGLRISAWADVPESLGQLVCPFCLQEARDIRPRPIRLGVIHAERLDDAEKVYEQLTSKYGNVYAELCELGPVVGAHTGPGLLALVWYEGDEALLKAQFNR